MDTSGNNQPAVDFDASAQIRRFGRAVKQSRFRLFLFTTIGVLLGALIGSLVPDLFEARALLLVRERELIENSTLLRAIREDKTLAQREQTLAQELRSYRWVQQVIERLGWPEYAVLDPADKRELIEKVRDPQKFTVQMTTDTSGDLLVALEFRWFDPRKARDFLQETYTHWIVTRDAENLSYYNAEFEKASSVLATRRAAYEQARAALDEFQLREGFTDFLSDTSPEVLAQVDRFKEKSQLEAEVNDLAEQIRDLEQQIRLVGPVEARTVQATHPLYKAKEAELAVAVQQLAPMAARMKAGNPMLAKPEENVAKLQTELAKLEAQGLRYINEVLPEPPAPGGGTKLSEQLALLRAALQGKNEKLKKVTQQYEALETSLARRQGVELDFRNLRNDYDEAQKNLNQARLDIAPLEDKLRILESGSTGVFRDAVRTLEKGSAFTVLEEPVVPKKSVGLPKVIFPILGGVLLFALAMALVLLGQVTRSTYDDADEVQRSLGIPILGSVGHIAAPGEQRRKRFAAVVRTLGSLLLVGSLGYFVYLVTAAPERLPLGMQQALDGLKSSLR